MYLQPGFTEYHLGRFASFLVDPGGRLEIDDIRLEKKGQVWRLSRLEVPSFSYTKDTYWFSIPIVNQNIETKDWYLQIDYALLDNLDVFFVFPDGHQHVYQAGDRFHFSQRPIQHRTFLFPLTLAAHQNVDIFIRVQTEDTMQLPIVLIQVDAFPHSEQTVMLVLAVIIAGMGLLSFYHVAAFFITYDIMFIYYTVFLSALTMNSLALFGFGYQYLWPGNTWIQQYAVFIMAPIYVTFSIFFSCHYLDLYIRYPLCYRWLYTLAWLNGITLAMQLWFDKTLVGEVQNFLILVTNTSLLLVGIRVWMAGEHRAALYCVAWSCYLLGVSMMIMNRLGWVPFNLLTQLSGPLGVLFTCALLSIALAQNIHAERLAKEKAQASALSASQESNKLKNDFLTLISHELRTPMNAIFGGVQLLDKNTEQEISSPLEIIRSGASEMMRLINDMLVYAEIQSGQLRVNTENIEIQSILKEMFYYYQQECQENKITLGWAVDDSVEPWLLIDEEKFKTIMKKLLDNAVKFTEKGNIKVDIRMEANQAMKTMKTMKTMETMKVEVHDTGIGISESEKESIYEAFRQRDVGLKRRFGGLGIGLSICQKLLQVMGGDLSVRSELGQGSCFSFYLPVVVGKLPSRQVNQLSLCSATLPILVVEDNLVNQKVMIKMLQRLGYQALVAYHGQEALDVLMHQQVSLILMDLQMPVMDGYSCTEKIRRSEFSFRNLPIIAVTANLMDADRDRCMQAGMNDFIKKPVKLDILKQSLSCYIAHESTS